MLYDQQKQQLDQQAWQQKLNEARRRARYERSFKGKVDEFASGKRRAKGKLGKNIQSEAKKVSKAMESLTPWGAFSVLSQISFFSDWMYGLALFAAILKDLLDMIEATGIGYFIVIVFTLLCSIFIALMMILGSFTNGTGRFQQKIIRSWLILIAGTTAELLFGVNVLPIETLTVMLVYLLMLSDRKAAGKERKNAGTAEAYA